MSGNNIKCLLSIIIIIIIVHQAKAVTGAQGKAKRKIVNSEEDESLDRFVKLILSFGFNINSKSREDKTLAYMAVENDDLEILKVLSKNGADLNEVGDFYELTPLILAAKKGLSDIVNYLASQGVDLNALDNEEKSALYRAVEQEELNCLQILLNHGADPFIRGQNEMSLMHEAAFNGEETIIKELTKFTALINAKDKENKTPLYYAAYKNHIDAVKILVEFGALINPKVMWGAVGGNDLSIVKYLIDKGGDVNSRDGLYNDTILMEAVTLDNNDITEFLLDKGADIEAKNNKGFTALHWAASWNRKSTTLSLLERNANINAKDNEGKIPLEVAGTETKQLLLQQAKV